MNNFDQAGNLGQIGSTSNEFDRLMNSKRESIEDKKRRLGITEEPVYEDTQEEQKKNKYNSGGLRDKSRLNQLDSLGEGLTEIGGKLYHNSNKIYNDFSDIEIQKMTSSLAKHHRSAIKDRHGNVIGVSKVSEDDDGVAYDEEVDINEPLEWVYNFNTKEKGSTVTKFGIASGHLQDPKGRFIPGSQAPGSKYTYGKTPGPKGVDPEDLNYAFLVPKRIAIAAEAIIHGRKQNLEHRVVDLQSNGYTSKQDSKDFGSGKTEYYYGNNDEILGQIHNKDDEYYKNLDFDKVIDPLELTLRDPAVVAKLDKLSPIRKDDSGDDTALSAFTAGLVRLGASIGDAALDAGSSVLNVSEDGTFFNGEGFGGGRDNRFFNKAKTTEGARKIAGYNGETADQATEAATEGIASGSLGGFINAIKIGIENPNITIESLPEMLALLINPFSKVGAANKAYKALDKAVAGKKSKKIVEEANKVVKDLTVVDQSIGKIIKAVPELSLALVETNNRLEERRLANGGVPEDAFTSVAVFAGEVLGLTVDKISFKSIIGDKGLLKNIKKSLTVLSDDQKKSLARKVIGNTFKVAGSLTSSAAKEGVTEYLQTWQQMLGKELWTKASAEAKEKGFLDVIGNEDNQEEALVGAAFGAAGGVHFGIGGSALQSVGIVSQKVNTKLNFKKETPEEASSNTIKFAVTNDYQQAQEMYPEGKDSLERKIINYDILSKASSPEKDGLATFVAGSLITGKDFIDPDGNKVSFEDGVSNIFDSLLFAANDSSMEPLAGTNSFEDLFFNSYFQITNTNVKLDPEKKSEALYRLSSEFSKHLDEHSFRKTMDDITIQIINAKIEESAAGEKKTGRTTLDGASNQIDERTLTTADIDAMIQDLEILGSVSNGEGGKNSNKQRATLDGLRVISDKNGGTITVDEVKDFMSVSDEIANSGLKIDGRKIPKFSSIREHKRSADNENGLRELVSKSKGSKEDSVKSTLINNILRFSKSSKEKDFDPNKDQYDNFFMSIMVESHQKEEVLQKHLDTLTKFINENENSDTLNVARNSAINYVEELQTEIDHQRASREQISYTRDIQADSDDSSNRSTSRGMHNLNMAGMIEARDTRNETLREMKLRNGTRKRQNGNRQEGKNTKYKNDQDDFNNNSQQQQREQSQSQGDGTQQNQDGDVEDNDLSPFGNLDPADPKQLSAMIVVAKDVIDKLADPDVIEAFEKIINCDKGK